MADRALVLVPGLLCDATIWQPQLDSLASSTEMTVARSTGHDHIAALARQALDAAPERFALAGHSLGGRIALEMLRQAPERIERLALLDTGVHPAGPGEREARYALVRLAEQDGMRAHARAWLPPMVHPDRRNERPLVDPLTVMVERSTPASFRQQQDVLLSRPDAGPVLATITCPTLVLVGREDAWSPLAQHKAIAAAVTGAVLRVIEHCGHMSTVERPVEVNAALREWLVPSV